MRMSKKTCLISLSAVAAVGVFACGDAATEPATDSGTTGGTYDAGTGTGTGYDSGSATQCTTIAGQSGVACTPAAGGAGYQLCTNGVPTGACMAFNIGSFLDGGLGDGGNILAAFDSGISFDAAALNIEAGTLKCPTGTECNGLLKSFTGGFSTCAQPGAFLPDPCSGTTACMVGTATGTCQSGFCIVPCN